MIARFQCVLPFSLFLLNDTLYNVFEVNDPPYRVRFYPPMKSNVPKRSTDPAGVTINGKPAHIATALQIDFISSSFSSKKANDDTDPPRVVINYWIDYLINRIRFVTNNNVVKSFNLTEITWQLTYYFDDETEIPENPSTPRKAEQKRTAYHLSPLLPDMWDDAHTLPMNFRIPLWKSLLLQSNLALSDMGLALVNAVTALEVLIATTLDILATKSPIPASFWDWINNKRGSKEPSTDEQFSDLLKLMTNRSLKENAELWTVYKELRQARNTYVHVGIPSVNNQPINFDKALNLLNGANRIADFVRESLPEELKWPTYKYTTKMLVEVNFADSVK